MIHSLAALVREQGGEQAARAFSADVESCVAAVVGSVPSRTVVLALGGLARRQLLPFSDVDLCFVVDGTDFDAGAIVSKLWDEKLKVSWSVRAPQELLRLFDDVSGKQGHAAMALLEARAIAGDVDFGRAVLRDLRRDIGARRRQALLEARVDEALARRARAHHSPSLVEPDLKDGPGGLRDVQLLAWAGLCRSGIDVGDDDVFDALLRGGALFPSEVQAVQDARAELLILRAALVVGAGRSENKMHADAAERAAAVVGEEGGGLRPGEAMVKRAVIAMRKVLVAVDDALVRFVPDRAPRRARDDAPRLSTLLSSSSPTFPGVFTGLLERGTLQPLLPDLARLTGRVKHDGIHAFTTDAHLCRCGDIAAAIVAGAGSDVLGENALPAPLQPILQRNASNVVVVASALLHDIGKGLPGDHSIVGEQIARATLSPFIDADDVDDVCFLVLHHLELSTTAQRRDLGDPQVIDDVAKLVRTPERLDALALLTWCDWCAVGPGVGTLWKAQLLRSCVDAVREALLSPATRARADDDVKAKARAVLAASAQMSDAFVDGASAAFLRGRDDDDLIDDARAFASGAVAVVDAAAPQRARVRCKDRPGLLADLAAAFASEGASVLDARLDVRADGDAFDAFAFDDGRGHPLPDDTAARLQHALEEAAAGRRRPVSRTSTSTSTPARVRFLESDKLVVEIRGGDRRGLLHDLARVFADHHLSITVARLHTEGARVTDVFSADAAVGVDVDRKALERDLLAVMAAGSQPRLWA